MFPGLDDISSFLFLAFIVVWLVGAVSGIVLNKRIKAIAQTEEGREKIPAAVLGPHSMTKFLAFLKFTFGEYKRLGDRKLHRLIVFHKVVLVVMVCLMFALWWVTF